MVVTRWHPTPALVATLILSLFLTVAASAAGPQIVRTATVVPYRVVLMIGPARRCTRWPRSCPPL